MSLSRYNILPLYAHLLLDFSFYFPGVLIGPSTRFVDYRAWANGTLYGPKGTLPPSGRTLVSLRELVTGLAYMGAWAVLSPRYSYANLVLPISDPASAKRLSPLGRIWYAQLAGLAARTKYYGVWTLTNVSVQDCLQGCACADLHYRELAFCRAFRTMALVDGIAARTSK